MSTARPLVSVALASIALCAAACSEAKPPGVSDDVVLPPGRAGVPPTAPRADAGALDAGDAAGDAEVTGPALCEDLEQRSQEVAEYVVPSPAPAPAGGAIEPGVYVLNELAVYDTTPGQGDDPPPPGPTGKLVRATLYVSPKSIRILESRGSDAAPLPPDTPRAYTYTTNGTNLELDPVCPAQAVRAAIPFTFQGNLLTFHVDATHAEIFRILR
jgi:hypothetical protein